MLKTFLLRLWQKVTRVFSRSQRDDQEAIDFKAFYLKEQAELDLIFAAPQTLSMAVHLQANRKLREAHQAAVQECLKRLDR
ncbi:relaxase domain-containing protein [Acaryochloris marina NIES-2412]|uniref:relaxase domain-containing protein n=1 Tax=Acaryochloris marina TaxID=155978 RepID=UPI0040580E1A